MAETTGPSRQLIVRPSASHPAYQVLLEVRRRLRALWMESEEAVLASSPP